MSNNKFINPISAELQVAIENFSKTYNSYQSQLFAVQSILQNNAKLYSLGLNRLVDLQSTINQSLEPIRQSLSQSIDLTSFNHLVSRVTELIPNISMNEVNEFVQTFEQYPIEDMLPPDNDEVVEIHDDTSLYAKLIKNQVFIFLLGYFGEKILDAGFSQIDFNRIFLEVLKLFESSL